MAKLTTKERNALPAKDFAGPDRSYPVNDKAHARNAKARASQNASPALKAKVDAKANKVLGKKRGTSTGFMKA
jgi:hypothetical protein